MIHTDTITLYWHEGDTWRRKVAEGVMLTTMRVRQRDSAGMIRNCTEIHVMIPAERLQGLKPDAGWIVVEGTGPEITAQYTMADLYRDDMTFAVVAEARDNTRRSCLKHWRLTAR